MLHVWCLFNSTNAGLFCNRSAKQALDWIHDTGDFYLSTHTQVGHNREETETLLQEHNEFKVTAKVRQMKNIKVFFLLYKVLRIYCLSSRKRVRG
jgi:hypothetical protein